MLKVDLMGTEGLLESYDLVDTGFISDRYVCFYIVESLESNHLLGFLRYDYISKESSILEFSEKHAYFNLTRVSTGSYLYYSALDWIGNEAIITIYLLDIMNMNVQKVYNISLQDKFTNDQQYSSIYRYLIHGLNERYLLIAIPELNPKPELQKFGFSEYLLIDIEMNVSYKVPNIIGLQDSILNLSSIDSYDYNNIERIILVTGRGTHRERKEEWKSKGFNMDERFKNQSVIIIPLDKFIENIIKQKSIDESFIIQKNNANTSLIQSNVLGPDYFITYTENFKDRYSEYIIYNILDGSIHSKIKLNEVYDRLYFDREKIFGLKRKGKDKGLYGLNSDKFYSLEDNEQIFFLNQRYIIIRNFLMNSDLVEYKVIELETNKNIKEVIGSKQDYIYIPKEKLLLFYNTQ